MKTPIETVCALVLKCWSRVRMREDLGRLSSRRLANIEDRLALLDSGEDSDAAVRTAYTQVNDSAPKEDKAALSFRLLNGGKVEWTGEIKSLIEKAARNG